MDGEVTEFRVKLLMNGAGSWRTYKNARSVPLKYRRADSNRKGPF